jgi:CMP-N-acetylneuraminic acid synthetase
MKIAAVIPARGGSKRLPRKNIREFLGHPLLAYAVSAALNAGIFERVLVSSDDQEIGLAAKWYGAEFLLRPGGLAGDTATLVDVAHHALEQLRQTYSVPDVLCQIMPNCPLVRSRDIIEHWELFSRHQRSFQISVVPYRAVYPEWTLLADEDSRGQWKFGRDGLVRSQELQRAYCPTGAIWLVKTADFVRQNAFYGDPFHIAPMDANRGIDIDTFEDFELAELLVRGLHSRDGESPLEPVRCGAFQHSGVA